MSEKEADALITSLFATSYSSLVRYVLRRAGGVEQAEELVQDALLAMFRQLCQGKSIQNPRAWLLTVLNRMAAREAHKKRQPELGVRLHVASLDTLELPPPIPGIEPGSITDLLQCLTPREQEVVLLRMESLKYREIAGILGVSKNTVNALLARALRKLQQLQRAQVTAGRSHSAYAAVKEPETLQ